jgi:hypothetical protein
MSDLLSSAEKTAISAAFDDLHDTFKRTITVFTKTITTDISNDYNGLWGKDDTPVVRENDVTSSTIEARLKFVDKAEYDKLPMEKSATNLAFPNGVIRLKIKDENYDLVRNSFKIEFGGLTYRLLSDAGKIGPFDINYYTLYFVRADV